jgi:hypothetical protein
MSTHVEKQADVSDDSGGSGDECWVKEVESRSKKDCRKQPWKSTFGDVVDSQLGGGKDLVKVGTVAGGSADYPFRVQGSSLAA